MKKLSPETEGFKPTAIGSNADIKAKVEIGKFMGGYFSNPENTAAFCETGIESIERNLPHSILYVDFGGGEGLLALSVKNFLEKSNHKVEPWVVDANPNYLEKAKVNGLNIKLCNIESCGLSNIDLATMRAALHYNPKETQASILHQIYTYLKPGGYFVHQVSSGNDINVRLRSEIVNIPSLGRGDTTGQYHWTSIEETLKIHEQAGFSENHLAGYAPSAQWSPLEMWERFNGKRLQEAQEKNDTNLVKQILADKDEYLNQTQKVIDNYLTTYGTDESGIKKLQDGNYAIHYSYPIIVSRK